MKTTRVLIVDDDAGIRELLHEYLNEHGLVVFSVEDGVAMDKWLSEQSVDIIILDVMLPGEDGLSIARRLRSQSSAGILMLSARSEDIDRIVGLEVGADDYLTKPFNPRELLARIRALMRRQQSEITKSVIDCEHIECFGPFRINFLNRSLHKNGEVISLAQAEFDLLKILAKKPNRILSRDILVDLLQGYNRNPFDRSIDVRITRLRKKMGEDTNNSPHIETIRGIGYRLNINNTSSSNSHAS